MVVSKNEQSVALEAIENHPEMVLRKDDFVGWRINWEDKARNLAELVEELNLGFQSVLFIDDNPAERARVKDTLPEVVVPDWPVDKTLSRQALLSLSCLNAVSVSDEDQHRTDMYQLEAKRRGIKASVSSFEDWLKDLGMTARVAELGKADIQRTTQLLNKTNQMNLSTRRMTESELLNWSYPDNRICWTFRVSDKFGDSGLTGIVSLELQDRVARMVDFVLSCRVMGRKVEETMLYVAVEYAREMGCEEVRAEYVETSKNKPCLDFWERSGLHLQDDNLFVWPTASLYPSPDGIVLLGM